MFLGFFVWRFWTPLAEKRPKNVIKTNQEKISFGYFGRFFCKNFSTRFFLQKLFYSVLELPSLRNAYKHDKTKNRGKTDMGILSIFL
jgi:hypothetical protein